MEKKTKKLQLRKETIAVLNGQRMTNVVGGVGYNPCENGGIFDGRQCVCPAGFVGLNCEQPVNGGTIIVDSTYCSSRFEGCGYCENDKTKTPNCA